MESSVPAVAELSTALPYAVPERFTVGSLIRRTFWVWKRNFFAFAGISLLLNSPVLVATVLLVAGVTSVRYELARPLLSLASWFLDLIVTGALTFGVIRSLGGKSVRFGEMVGIGFSRIMTIFVASFAVGIRIFFGLLLLIIPGIVIMTQLWVAVPAAMAEPNWRLSSLDRSRELTKDHRLTIFLAFVLFFVLAALLGGIIGLLGPAMLGNGSAAELLFNTVLGVVLNSLLATAPAVAYHDLRLLKEGGSTEQLAAVFE